MIDLERRAFFKRGIKRATRTAVDYADEKAVSKMRWIRPPYAIEELDFLLACTRCGDCVSACEYEVIFNLPAKFGSTAINTPAMDLLNKGCHLCDGWPCVTACKPAALKLPLTDQDDTKDDTSEITEAGSKLPLPKLAIARVLSDQCLPFQGPECGACRSSCPVEGALSWDMTKPVINDDLCCGCGLCRESCITEPHAIAIYLLSETITQNA